MKLQLNYQHHLYTQQGSIRDAAGKKISTVNIFLSSELDMFHDNNGRLVVVVATVLLLTDVSLLLSSAEIFFLKTCSRPQLMYD